MTCPNAARAPDIIVIKNEIPILIANTLPISCAIFDNSNQIFKTSGNVTVVDAEIWQI